MLCGSVFAPAIGYVTNLVYQLMRAIQSVVYAFSGVNIFAKATASSMKSSAGSAKQASKALAGGHNEINNVSENSDSGGNGSVVPDIDLSQLNLSDSIIGIIREGNWYEIGAIAGRKLNETMNSIPWEQIQNGVRNIIRNIVYFLNGFILETDWRKVGDTFAQSLNTIIYAAYEFVTTFDWIQFGTAIGNGIDGFVTNINWSNAGQLLGEGIKGIFNSITTMMKEIDWNQLGEDIKNFLVNIDWCGITESIFTAIGTALGGLAEFLIGLLGDAWLSIQEYFTNWIEGSKEQGASIVGGIMDGIANALINIGQWIYDYMIRPIVDAFCSMLGIHSPSTVFAEFGKYIIQGLLSGIQSLLGIISQVWINIKETAIIIFNSIKDVIMDIWNSIVSVISNVWNIIVTKIKEGVLGAWNAITSVFGNIGNWFKDKFSQAWQAVKNIFSTGGAIFDGIKNGILSSLKVVINAIINGINKVIAIPFNGLNTALRKIRDLTILGINPFSWLLTISVPQIPTLAKGGVLYDEALVRVGEYAGARSNPEIVTPQNIMYDTMIKALEDSHISDGDNRPIRLQVYLGTKNVVDEIIDGINEKTRRTGKAQIKVAYDY